ncbi:hypothetical protein TKK_0017186 [Trichogramma kaykai]|uniref:Transcription factor CBF/NF-Y/archaeal histone domain-containing protein n=1 Tax=Trichogramma kaykai TaxID=54128 RepID=A0ABD2W4Q4_9HYME
MPSKKKKYNSRFPPSRIKKIMQTDEEVGKVAQPVPIIIYILFITTTNEQRQSKREVISLPTRPWPSHKVDSIFQRQHKNERLVLLSRSTFSSISPC